SREPRRARLRFGGRFGAAVRAPEPAQRASEIARLLDVELDPAARAEASVRANPRVGERLLLIVLREPDPEIAVLVAKGKAREQRLAEEIAPASELGRDADAGPGAERLVQPACRTGAAARQLSSRLAAAPHATESPGFSHSRSPRWSLPLTRRDRHAKRALDSRKDHHDARNESAEPQHGTRPL